MRRRRAQFIYVLAGTAFQASVYSLLPLLFARGDGRRGWRDGRPGRLNRLGVVPIALGTAFIASAAAGHSRAAPHARFTPKPEYLAEEAAYSISRNPLYVGGMTIWLGWATVLGSRCAAAVGAGWLAGLAKVGIPYEERMLEARFADQYRSYCDRVPRWL